MATLDDKLLGEKLHYYCSSSEDEDESPVADSSTAPPPPPSIGIFLKQAIIYDSRGHICISKKSCIVFISMVLTHTHT